MVYKTFLTHTGVYYGGMRDGAAYGLLTEVNELAAQGVHAGSAEIRIEIPADMDKSRMHSIRNHIAKAMEKLETEDFQLEELHIAGEKCAALRVPQIVITAAGETDQKERIADALLTARAGQDIVYAGWAGLEGMLRIIGEKEAELRERFTPAFIGQMKAYDSELCGLSKIAVRQETIEVCEHFRLNPYQLASGGSFLMLTENGEALADALNQKGIQAAVIGQLTDSNDKIIHNGEDMRYIDRPAPDELMKVF